MTKSAVSAVIGLTLALAAAVGFSAYGPSTPEIAAVRVVRVPGRDSADKAAVVSGLAVCPGGTLLATVGDDHLVRIWSLPELEPLHALAGHSDWVRTAVFRPDGRVLATAGDDRRIRLWEVSSGQRLTDFSAGPEVIYALAYSPDGRMLAAAGFDDKVRIYVDAGSESRLVRELDAPGGDIRAVAFSPGGKQVAAGGRSGIVRIWQADSGNHLADLENASRRIYALAYSPDGTLLAAGGDRGTVRLWSTAGGTGAVDLPQRPGTIMALAFCGQRRLAAGTSANAIHLWELGTRQEQFRLVGHTGSVAALAWEDTASRLLSGGFDCTVRLWPWNPAATRGLGN